MRCHSRRRVPAQQHQPTHSHQQLQHGVTSTRQLYQHDVNNITSRLQVQQTGYYSVPASLFLPLPPSLLASLIRSHFTDCHSLARPNQLLVCPPFQVVVLLSVHLHCQHTHLNAPRAPLFKITHPHTRPTCRSLPERPCCVLLQLVRAHCCDHNQPLVVIPSCRVFLVFTCNAIHIGCVCHLQRGLVTKGRNGDVTHTINQHQHNLVWTARLLLLWCGHAG